MDKPQSAREAFYEGMRKAILDPLVWLVITALTTGSTWVIRGPLGGQGVALGLGFAFFSLFVIRRMVLLMGDVAPSGPKASFGIFLTMVLFLIKVPIFFGAMIVVYRLGDPAPGCFVAGIVLVYSGSIGWALARR